MAEIIQSTQNPQVKRLKELGLDASARRKVGLYLLEGVKLCREAMAAGARVKIAAMTQGCELAPDIAKAGVETLWLGDKAFASVSDTESPQGIILLLEMPRPGAAPQTPSLAVAAEKIQDPGNLGTLLRSAWASGVDALYLSEGCADPWSPKALRAAAGAQPHLNIETQANLHDRLGALAGAGVQTIALEPDSKLSLWDLDLKKASCLVLGSEGQGLSATTLKACMISVKIETPGLAESLNAGVSVSIALFEALRQRRQ